MCVYKENITAICVCVCVCVCVCIFPGDSVIRNPPAEQVGLIPGWGRAPGEGNSYPLQYACLENSMDRETWGMTVHGVAKNAELSD